MAPRGRIGGRYARASRRHSPHTVAQSRLTKAVCGDQTSVYMYMCGDPHTHAQVTKGTTARAALALARFSTLQVQLLALTDLAQAEWLDTSRTLGNAHPRPVRGYARQIHCASSRWPITSPAVKLKWATCEMRTHEQHNRINERVGGRLRGLGALLVKMGVGWDEQQQGRAHLRDRES